MNILIRSARIIATGSKFHQQVKDILVVDGKIKKIGSKLPNTSKAKEIKIPNLHVSTGWVDLNAHLADPGFEHRETIETGCAAAAKGGFTHICCMPDTQPVIETKTQVEYVKRKSAAEIVEVHPVGALTQHVAGKDLAEMYDMHRAGAIAFSDGLAPSVPAGVLERALLYVKAFNGLVMVHPEDKSVAKNGAMHEGVTSTRMGLPAAPALAEEIAVNRDLYVLEYTGSRLHFLDISLGKSVELIKAARKKKLQVSFSVNAYNLLLNETAVGNYNTLYKVNPHLRPAADVAALVKAVADGTVDTITSAHRPHDEEGKKLEFDKAEFGMIGLETCFAIANTALKGKAGAERLVQLLSDNPRQILGLPATIAEGAPADLTLFDPDMEWTFSTGDILSKSKNTPFVGTTFTGKVWGVVNKGKVQLQ